MQEISNDHLKRLWDQVCLHDDLKSFELLFYQLNRNLLIFCDTIIHNEAAAEELVSDLFVHVWNNRATLTHVLTPRSYLYAAVKNKSLNYLKQFSHLQLQVDLSDNVAVMDSTDPNTLLERKEFFAKIDSIIARLPTQTLLVFRLVKEDGMKYDEVAKLLHISPRTVQTHMRIAFQKISGLLKSFVDRDKARLSNKFYTLVGLISLFFQIF